MNLSSRLVGLLAAATLLLQPVLARAQEAAVTTVTSYALTCTSFSGSGTSTAPYVEIYVNNNTASKVLVWVGQAVPQGGTFSFNVSFPAQSAGSQFDVEVWGETQLESGNSVYWDGGSYFSAGNITVSSCNLPAATAPSLSTAALAGMGLLLTAVAGVMLRRRRSGES